MDHILSTLFFDIWKAVLNFKKAKFIKKQDISLGQEIQRELLRLSKRRQTILF